MPPHPGSPSEATSEATNAGRRKRERNPDQKRAAILTVASAEFASRGFSGARVDRIAAQAGINKSILYYHFKGKEALYIEVLNAAYADIRGKELALGLDSLAPEDANRRLVEFTFDYYIVNPGFVQLLNSENLLKGRYLAKSARIDEINAALIRNLQAVLDIGVAQGVFREGVDAPDLYLSISALGYLFVSNRHTLQVTLRRDLTDPANVAARRRSIVDMVLRYLRA